MSVYTEWDPLEEIIVGDCYSPGDLDWCIPPDQRSAFDTMLMETKSDLDYLAHTLQTLGAKVHRPKVFKYSNEIQFDSFSVKEPFSPMVPRDQYLVYGNTIYQTYTSMPDRYLDSLAYYNIFQTMFAAGANWISQPPPMLRDLRRHFEYQNLDPTVNRGTMVYEKLYKNLLLTHTATMFKCGDRLITNTRGPGTQLGLEWMRKNLPAETIVSADNILQNWGHVDHGFFMTDDDTVFCVGTKFVPKCLQNKKIYDITPYIDVSHLNLAPHSLDGLLEDSKGYTQVVMFYANVIVVDSQNIVMNHATSALKDFFLTKNITVHVSPFRHMNFWFGNLHCVTLDIKRRGQRRKIINEI
jgi:glycine amidinotransferase